MKQIDIPYLACWTNDLKHVSSLLHERGRRVYIGTRPWADQYPYQPVCVATLGHCELGLLVHYDVRSLDLRTLAEHDGCYVHEDSCVEIFLQRERGEAYINFEFNAAGVCYASHHASPTEGTRFTPEEYSAIQRWATYKGEKRDEKGLHTWELTAIIPWRLLGYDSGQYPSSLWGNLYKCADGTAHPHYLSWAPIEEEAPAFHRPQFFGELRLVR